jgi:hypothetical protein
VVSLAKALNDLAVAASGAGQMGTSVSSEEETVKIFRRVAGSNPEVFRPELAAALSNLAVMLSRADRVQEAIDVATECVTLYQSLASRNYGVYERPLAIILNVLQKLNEHEG